MYNTTDSYKSKIYNVNHFLKVYINDVEIESKYILDCRPSSTLFTNGEIELGSTPSQTVELKLYKSVVPATINKVEIKSGITGEIVPVGVYNVDKAPTSDDYTVTLSLADNMIKFEFNYDGSKLVNGNNGKVKIIQVLQDMCSKAGVELGTTSFLNMNKEIAVYDNTVSARTYLSYISEQAGGFAFIGRDGKLYIRSLGQDMSNISLKLFQNFEWGEKYKITKVRFDDGIRVFEKGNTTGNTMYINPNNMFIVDQEQVDNIYEQVKDLELYSFKGNSIIDPAIDIGDILVIDGKQVLYQGSSQYSGRWKSSISSEIKSKERQETTTVKKPSQKTINRRVQSSINQIDGKITQLAQETTENTEKIAEHEVSIDKISDKVSNIADLTKDTNSIKTVVLNNCLEGEILEFHIYGNNAIFKPLVLSNDLYLSDELYLTDAGSFITVTDEDGNVTDYYLKITDVLRQNGEVKDEYILENGQAKVIRRINEDGTIKDVEEIEDLGELHIVLAKGKNIIEIKEFSANIYAKWAVQNEYTDIFATKVEMSSNIEQTSQQITSSVDKKLENYSTTTEMNSVITQTAESINSEVRKKVGNNEVISKINQSSEAIQILANKLGLTANDILDIIAGNSINLSSKNITINSNNFNVDKDGKMTCNNATVKGKITSSEIDGSTIKLGGDADHPEFIADTDDGYRTTIFPLGLINEYDMSGTYVAVEKGGIGLGLFTDSSMEETASIEYNEIRIPIVSQTSLKEYKKNFEKIQYKAIDVIKDIDIYEYNLKHEKDTDKKHIGFVIGNDFNYSRKVTSSDNKGVDSYSFISLCCKAIQEQQEQIESLQRKIKEMEEDKCD